MNEDNTGLPEPCAPDMPSPGNAEELGPGGRPGNIEGAEVRPKPKGEAALGTALGANPGYMEVGGWLEMLVVGDTAGMDEGMEAGGREEDRVGNGERPG